MEKSIILHERSDVMSGPIVRDGFARYSVIFTDGEKPKKNFNASLMVGATLRSLKEQDNGEQRAFTILGGYWLQKGSQKLKTTHVFGIASSPNDGFDIKEGSKNILGNDWKLAYTGGDKAEYVNENTMGGSGWTFIVEEVHQSRDKYPPSGSEIELTFELPDSHNDEVEETRAQFTTLMLSNPNYFGTFPELDLPIIIEQTGNTTYEEAVCLGLHPDDDVLEAVVEIKRPFGYGSSPCGDGSIEYVRFYVERSPGVWEDIGVSSFRAYNMPNSAHPLCYTVTIDFDDARKYCTVENLLNVRAILSWNLEPPAGNPSWTPPWGNAIDAMVQIDPFKLEFIPVGDLVADQILQINSPVLSGIDLEKSLPTKPKEELSYAVLKKLYADAKVPKHRFGFKAAQALKAQPVTSKFLLQSAQVNLSDEFSVIPSVDLSDIFDDLVATQGNTNYEELLCAGYNPSTKEVGAVLSIKRSSGFSGGLCTKGSTEYVGFWVHNGFTWIPLGVTNVQVYDLNSIGAGDTVEYAVIRPTNGVPEFPCEGLQGLRLRAILSWNTPPTGPNFDPTWGNVIDTFIQPPDGQTGNENELRLFHINRAPIDSINDFTGRSTNLMPASGECSGVDRPFGNLVFIEGDFLFKPHVFNDQTGDVLGGANPLRYRISWKKAFTPDPFNQLTNSFSIRVYPKDPPPGPISVLKTQSTTPDGTGGVSYTYYESIFQAVNPRILGVWNVSNLENGLYTLVVEGLVWNGATYVVLNTSVQNIYVYNGFPHQITIPTEGGGTTMVDRLDPELMMTLSGGECGEFNVGDILSGSYQVRDEFFGSLGVNMVPITFGGTTFSNPVTITNPGVQIPNPGIVPSVQTVNGNWSLDTAGLPACGYVVELGAWDRALVGMSCSGHYNRLGVGFCLKNPDEE